MGRPRDPDIEPRVYEAALRVYSRDGWGGFTFDAVAREAKVGKPAVYRRWASREELLVSAVERLDFPAARDCGSLQADLHDYAMQFVDWYSRTERALAAHRLAADYRSHPELRSMWDRHIKDTRVPAALEIGRRASARGELIAGTYSSTPVELLLGALDNHWRYTPEAKMPEMLANLRAYAETLVAAVLHGILAVPDPLGDEVAGGARPRPARAHPHSPDGATAVAFVEPPSQA